MIRKWMAAGFGIMLAAAGFAAHASDAQILVDRASLTLDDVQNDPAFGNARDLLRRAQAVMIIPALFKGGFFVGGEGGTGVLLTRQYSGWSQPAFYTMASASLGFQIGAQRSEVVLIILSDRAKRAFMADKFKIGAEAGLAIVTLGSEAEAATTGASGNDIVAWASSAGAYAGVAFNGSVIEPRESYDQAYYGSDVSSYGIVMLNQVRNPGADALRQKLLGMAGP